MLLSIFLSFFLSSLLLFMGSRGNMGVFLAFSREQARLFLALASMASFFHKWGIVIKPWKGSFWCVDGDWDWLVNI